MDEQKNKIVALQRHAVWYAAIECGYWNMIPASMDFFKNKDTGMVYKWYQPILDPPTDLQPYQEIIGGTKHLFHIQAVEYEKAFEFEKQELMMVTLLRRMGTRFNLDPDEVEGYLHELNNEATDASQHTQEVSASVH